VMTPNSPIPNLGARKWSIRRYADSAFKFSFRM
jgi:hypothetical protein